jgi:hypothetical protein
MAYEAPAYDNDNKSVSVSSAPAAPPTSDLQEIVIRPNGTGGFTVTCVHGDGQTENYEAAGRAELNAYLDEKVGPAENVTPPAAQMPQATGDEPV